MLLCISYAILFYYFKVLETKRDFLALNNSLIIWGLSCAVILYMYNRVTAILIRNEKIVDYMRRALPYLEAAAWSFLVGGGASITGTSKRSLLVKKYAAALSFSRRYVGTRACTAYVFLNF
ncbi:hypothetical protein PUN28_001886 [Cardiocondyla obscurior]|uniref:Uncharacterized protein n=1 Tax=Cardiocondyla obscurior TaxID=286306 RepID=A0AAW2GRV9_9HYME